MNQTKHPLDIDFSLLDELRARAVAARARDDAEAAEYQRKDPAPRAPHTPVCIVRPRTPAVTVIRHDRGYEDLPTT